jgi:hypothetical protein
MCVVTKAAKSLVCQRFLLQGDADRLIGQASANKILLKDAESSDEARGVAKLRCAE